MVEKKLFRSKTDRMVAGVCAGIAKYFDIDPTIIRLMWVFIVMFGGAGILAYIICWIVIPEEKE
nr:PspC domain-containing protein [Caloramator mitchellensis]